MDKPLLQPAPFRTIGYFFKESLNDHTFPIKDGMDLVYLEADRRVVPHHEDLLAFGRLPVNISAAVNIVDRHDIGAAAGMAGDPAGYLFLE